MVNGRLAVFLVKNSITHAVIGKAHATEAAAIKAACKASEKLNYTLDVCDEDRRVVGWTYKGEFTRE
jgi:phosphoribosylformimino-5-aminoimidazole carboxamide ribonucleotide (ProFAR) isomerase